MLKNHLNSMNFPLVAFEKVGSRYKAVIQPPKSRKRILKKTKTKKQIFQTYPDAKEVNY